MAKKLWETDEAYQATLDENMPCNICELFNQDQFEYCKLMKTGCKAYREYVQESNRGKFLIREVA